MKTYTLFPLIVIFSSLVTANDLYAQDLDIQVYGAAIQKQFEPFNNTQITYEGFEFYKVKSLQIQSEIDFHQKNIKEAQQILDARKNGTLSKEEEKYWAKITNEDLENIVEQNSNALDGKPTKVKFTLSTDGVKIREDVNRPEEPIVQDHFYLFDGINGTMTTLNDNKVRAGDFLTLRWTDFKGYSRYGSGMEKAFAQPENYQTRLVSEDGKQKLVVETGSQQNRNCHVEFTLLDSNPYYWTQCDHVQNGKVIMRYICEDFENHDGLLVPRSVHKQRPSKNGLSDDFEITLSDAKVNVVEFGEDFFKASPSESPIVRLMERR